MGLDPRFSKALKSLKGVQKRISESTIYPEVQSITEQEYIIVRPKEAPPRPVEEVLGQLVLVLDQAEQLQEHAQRLVTEAREQGATWAQIGEATGVKPQSAYQRWTETGREKNREKQRRRRA